jgi:hypothetical protein
MVQPILAGLLLLQAAPTIPPPATPAAPAPTQVEDVRFCIAAVEAVAAMMRAQGSETAMQAAFLEGAVPTLQGERTQLGDTDDAALDAERARLRGAMAGGSDAAPTERERFMRACMPRLRTAMGGR